MFKVIFYFFLIFLMFGCSSKFSTIKDEYVLFSKADDWSKAKGMNKVVVGDSKKEKIVVKKDLKVEKGSKKSTLNFLEPPKFDNIEFRYKIVSHDRASLIVYKHPELSSTTLSGRATDRGLLINADGDIKIPLIKSIHVEGLTQTEAQNKIENAFKKYLKSPDIYFEILNKRAYIIGEVNSPGEIELVNEKLTLLQLISKAGDLKDSADKTKIMILRNGKNKINSEIVNLVDFNSLKTANLMIKPNDIVYVLPNDMKIFNKKVDEVNPIVRLIGSMLSPFITLKVLSSWGN